MVQTQGLPIGQAGQVGQVGSVSGSSPRSQSDSVHTQLIGDSHERSAAFGLTPNSEPDLHRLSDVQLQEARERNARLCAQALPVMDMLYEQLTHAQSMVLLTDASGVILHARGDDGFMARAHRVALEPGGLWSEADKGTNGIGTTLMSERPTLVHGQEHFLRATQFLTCSAAPIFNHKGALMGVVDVSGDRRSFHPHTLALADMAARLIENQWFGDKFRNMLRLRFHPNAHALGTLQEGVLAIDEDGRVLGSNRRALELLGEATSQLRRGGLPALFDIGMGQLIDRAQQCPDQALLLATLGPTGGMTQVHAKVAPGLRGSFNGSTGADGDSGFDTFAESHPMPLTAPGILTPETMHLVSERATTLREAELRAIQSAVQNCSGNLSMAARQLGIGRSTLYRKIKELGVA